MNTEVIYVIVSKFDHLFNELCTEVVYSESLLSFLSVDPMLSLLDLWYHRVALAAGSLPPQGSHGVLILLTSFSDC